jgi:hypothetical protein
VECYVCHETVAVPAYADRGARWVHTHCVGNTPTIPEMVTAFLTAFPRERFCVDCVARLIGLHSRRDVDGALAVLNSHVCAATGRCARCPTRTRVVGIALNGDMGPTAH